MKLSVIIPIYNVEKYIKKCIESLINNDLDSTEYEIIVIDDESPDNSLKIAEEMAQQYSNITIISQLNKGLGGARNTGISAAKGDFLLFLDSDDWYLEHSLQQLLAIAIENQIEILEFAAQGISPDGKVAYHISNTSNGKTFSGLKYYNSIRYMNSACNKLYNRNFLVSNELFFLEKIYIEDFEFNTRAFLKANKVMATDLLVAQFLQSENSITRNKDNSKKEKVINDFIHIVFITNDLYRNKKKSNDIDLEIFFQERLSFLVATLFFQLLKYKVSYDKMLAVKKELEQKNIFYIQHAIYDKRKDIFRKLFMKNFFLFRFLKLFF